MNDSGGDGMVVGGVGTSDGCLSPPNPDALPATSSAAATSAAAASTSHASSSAAADSYFRQFHENYVGILEVWIRSSSKTNMKVPTLRVQDSLNKRFKSISSIIPGRDHLSVIFGNLREANCFIKNPYLPDVSVSIPASRVVDIEGAVRADEFEGMFDTIDELPKIGRGLFGTDGLLPCRILRAVRLPRAPDAGGAVKMSNTVRITFEGALLPKYVCIRNVRIPVRLFTKGPMFCETCQSIGHTSKRCRRPIKCARCGCGHETADCSNPTVNKTLCPRCAKQHPDSRSLCPFFQQVSKDFKEKQIVANRRRYKQTVAALEAANANAQRIHRQAPELNNANFPPLRNAYASLAVADGDQPIDEDQNPDEDQAIDVDPASESEDGPGPNSFPPPPKNPYAARHRGRSASKRHRDGSLSVCRRPARQPASQPPARQQPVPHSNHLRQPASIQRQPQSSAPVAPRPAAKRNLPAPSIQSSALRLVILTLARQLGLSEALLTILEAVIDPLLPALLPNADAIVAAVTPHLSSIQ